MEDDRVFLNKKVIIKSPVTINLRANILISIYGILSNNCKILNSNSTRVGGVPVQCTLASSQANSGTCSHVKDKCFYSKWSMIDTATTIILKISALTRYWVLIFAIIMITHLFSTFHLYQIIIQIFNWCAKSHILNLTLSYYRGRGGNAMFVFTDTNQPRVRSSALSKW